MKIAGTFVGLLVIQLALFLSKGHTLPVDLSSDKNEVANLAEIKQPAEFPVKDAAANGATDEEEKAETEASEGEVTEAGDHRGGRVLKLKS